ncbi:uncharacterized protein LOC111029469 [Myzus persicae]|uniref:uncharacterized protein LOC111029469 n=1 Tax=Myzus persicae TaxID=13164 RepID=UPI000B937D2B|nr:uncharacterized protein LOC111029469 [Myzus persicae]
MAFVRGCDGTFKVVPTFLENDMYQLFTFHVIYKDVILALPYLPAIRQGDIVKSMIDEFQSIVDYVHEYPEIAAQLTDFLLNYVWAYWFGTMGPSAITVYNQDIRTNNYIETYHATILRLIKPHPKVWEFLSEEELLIHAAQ